MHFKIDKIVNNAKERFALKCFILDRRIVCRLVRICDDLSTRFEYTIHTDVIVYRLEMSRINLDCNECATFAKLLFLKLKHQIETIGSSTDCSTFNFF